MNQKFRAFLDQHCVWLNTSIKAINDNLILALQDKASCKAAADEVLTLTHQIKGTSGSMGFKEVSDAAASLDSELRPLFLSEDTLNPDIYERCIALFRVLKAVADNTTPQSSSLYNTDLG